MTYADAKRGQIGEYVGNIHPCNAILWVLGAGVEYGHV